MRLGSCTGPCEDNISPPLSGCRRREGDRWSVSVTCLRPLTRSYGRVVSPLHRSPATCDLAPVTARPMALLSAVLTFVGPRRVWVTGATARGPLRVSWLASFQTPALACPFWAELGRLYHILTL